MFQFIEECNAIRRSLGLGELRVTSEMMAYAISDCNWSDTSRSHARQFNVGENLAWGYGKESYQLGGYQSATATANPFYGWYDEEKAVYDEASFEAARTAMDLGTAQSAYNQAHEDAETARTERESAKQAADGALAVLSTARTESDAADDAYVAARSIDDARIEQREVDQTYTADMTDPDNGISGLAARKVWRSIPSQLLRSSTKKIKYSEVERGGRRAKLIESLDWLEAAGIISINALTDCAEAPLVPYDDTGGSFFKVYLSDTGLMFYKLGLNPRLWLESQEQGLPLGSSDFRGALAENSVMQALRSNDLQTYVCVLSRTP